MAKLRTCRRRSSNLEGNSNNCSSGSDVDDGEEVVGPNEPLNRAQLQDYVQLLEAQLKVRIS